MFTVKFIFLLIDKSFVPFQSVIGGNKFNCFDGFFMIITSTDFNIPGNCELWFGTPHKTLLTTHKALIFLANYTLKW